MEEMNMLHIINKSPFERNALDSCLRVAQPGNSLLLIEDAVYAAARGNKAADKVELAARTLKVYVLAPDLEARGMKDAAVAGVTLVDYSGFVDLVAEHSVVQSWL
jgi:tRNA 2-thiouridine synthesizing protein B